MTPTTSSRHSTRGRVMLPLIALAADAFGIGTTEFSPMGLSPEIADSLRVSIASAGMLVMLSELLFQEQKR
jgi:DHA1 family inner membrane transport protein